MRRPRLPTLESRRCLTPRLRPRRPPPPISCIMFTIMNSYYYRRSRRICIYIYIYIYIHMYLYFIFIFTYIYIYIERERESERERVLTSQASPTSRAPRRFVHGAPLARRAWFPSERRSGHIWDGFTGIRMGVAKQVAEIVYFGGLAQHNWSGPSDPFGFGHPPP